MAYNVVKQSKLNNNKKAVTEMVETRTKINWMDGWMDTVVHIFFKKLYFSNSNSAFFAVENTDFGLESC